MPQRKRSCSRPELPHKTFIDTMVCGFVIVIKKNGTDGDKYPMVNDECLLGRGEGCDIRIELPGASKEHARIKVQAYSHRKVYITALSKTNATKMNNKVLENEVPHLLQHNDVFTIADRSFRWEFPIYLTEGAWSSLIKNKEKLEEELQKLRPLEALNENLRKEMEILQRKYQALRSDSEAMFSSIYNTCHEALKSEKQRTITPVHVHVDTRQDPLEKKIEAEEEYQEGPLLKKIKVEEDQEGPLEKKIKVEEYFEHANVKQELQGSKDSEVSDERKREPDDESKSDGEQMDSKLNQPYNPFAPLSPCGSASPYDPASPTESATPPSDSGITGPVKPKSLAKRLKRLARRGSFDAPAPSILLCPDIPPLEKTFGEIYTYASFLEIENDASMPSMSPPQEDPLEHCESQITVKKNEVTESPKEEAESKSSQSKSKGMSAKSNFTGKKSQLEKIRDEVKSELKPYLARGNISKKIYEKILTKSIPKIYNSKDKAINKPKIRRLVQEYVKNYQQQQVVKSI